MSVWGNQARARRRVTAMVAVTLMLLGPRVPSGPALTGGPPVAQGIQPAAAAPDPLPPYQIGYVSADVPRILTVNLPDIARPRLLEDIVGEQPSANSSAVVFVRHRDGHVDTDLAYLSFEGGRPVALTADDFTDRHPALSPDGTQVAFESDRGGQSDIWAIRVNGTGLRRITDNPAEETWPSWSPAGDRIAFSSTRDDPNGDIYTVPASGGPATRITTDPAADTEPAFSPSGTQIAFTTTRFEPDRVIATVPPGGGQVTRLIAGEQAAWSPNGSSIAFVSRERDPSGDVYLFELGSEGPAVVSARSATAETNPTWTGSFQVLLGIVDGAESGDDVWSANAVGADRHDLTNRPGLSEAGPAYSPDGQLVAYTEFNDDSDGRLVVSDADGRHPRALTDFVELQQDLDPTWSPDGKLIAFSRGIQEGDLAAREEPEPPNPAIMVVRVADGEELGPIIPAPSNLSNVRDVEPSWSPDGTHIAFVRRSTTKPAVPISPLSIGRPVRPGGTTSLDEVISTPVIPPKPDVVFMIDTTGSMASTISAIHKNVDAIVNSITGSQPDAQFALIGYRAAGDVTAPYKAGYFKAMPLQEIDPQHTALRDALSKLDTGGGIGQEDWLYAMHQILAGDITFRPGSTRIVVLVGDAPSANDRFDLTVPGSTDPSPACPPPLPGPPIAGPRPSPSPSPSAPRSVEVPLSPPVLRPAQIAAVPSITPDLGAQGIRVIAAPIKTQAGELGLDFCHQAKLIAGINDGELLAETPAGEGGDFEGIKQIITGLQSLRVTVTPLIHSCDRGLTVTLAPAGPTTVTGGVPVHYRQTMTVAAGVAPGTQLHCDVDYALSPSGGTYTVPIDILVARPDLPLVSVDDVTVRVPGPSGAVVNYNATAVDSAGRTLTPLCKPLSGTVFPIGQTLVTCVAVDSSGRVGTDTALISVSESDADRSARIWAGTLAFSAPDTISVTAQVDLGTRVGAPCRTAPNDAGPAWSTDGSQLAFTRNGTLCVTDPAGGRARAPLTLPPTGFVSVSDPAWSPDGMVIAVAWTAGDELTHTTLRTVPVGGGPDTIVIDTPGGAFQPAFRPLVTTGLTVTITTAPQPAYVRGPPIVVKAVGHNGARVAARRVRLTVQVPPELGGAPVPVFVETLAPGAEITLTVSLPARAAVAGAAIATLTGSYPGDRAVTAQAQTPILVIQPVLLLETTLGPPGFVTIAAGSGFPPGTTVALTWNSGISGHEIVAVAADGTFRRQILVFHHDRLGPRLLIGSGTGFGDVNAGFLVVPGTSQPDDFVDRR